VTKLKSCTYVLTLNVITQKFQEDVINKRLEIARNISNSLTNKVLKRYKLMLESKEYNIIKNKLRPTNRKLNKGNINSQRELIECKKELYKELKKIYLKYGLSQYSLYEDVKPMYQHFKDNICSLETQAIADRVWNKFDKLLFGNAHKVRFTKIRTIRL